jgi:hemerythrin-like domain-containing protein
LELTLLSGELRRPLLSLLLPREEPESFIPPCSRSWLRDELLSLELREEPPDPLDPDDLFDWLAISILLGVLPRSGSCFVANDVPSRIPRNQRSRAWCARKEFAPRAIVADGEPNGAARVLNCPIARRIPMPKSKSGAKAQPLAIEMLLADHRKVEDLFEQYEGEKEGDDDTKRAIAKRICGELTVHAQVEEELFYPWLRDNLDEDDMEMVEEAQVEHNGARDLIAQIEASEEVDATYDAMVKVLSEYIKHHVKEEENEIFPAVSGKREELDDLGQEMSSRKEELIEELGLAEEEEDDSEDARDSRPGSHGASTRRDR